jgi:hypothetical protein
MSILRLICLMLNCLDYFQIFTIYKYPFTRVLHVMQLYSASRGTMWGCSRKSLILTYKVIFVKTGMKKHDTDK